MKRWRLASWYFPICIQLPRELNTSYNLILSATMFDGLIYEINMKTHRLSISVPDEETLVRNLRIVDSEGCIHILYN